MNQKIEKIGDAVKKVDQHKGGMIFWVAMGGLALAYKAIEAIAGLGNDGAKEPAKA